METTQVARNSKTIGQSKRSTLAYTLSGKLVNSIMLQAQCALAVGNVARCAGLLSHASGLSQVMADCVRSEVTSSK